MNKTISINLGGFFFHIDEDAYQKLSRYFEAVKRSLSPEGREEIIKDIEGRIAEIFQSKLKSDKQVIVLKDIDDMIAIMGQPEDYKIDEEEKNNTSSSMPNFQNFASKKLYRDKDNALLGGVLSGLGHYFGIDSIWLRILMVILFFGYGTGLLVYIILWILMPPALSTSQKLEMKGEPITISNIEKKVKEGFTEISDKINSIDHQKITSQARQGAERVSSNIGEIFLSIFKVFGKIIGAFIVVFSAMSLIGIVIVSFIMIVTSTLPDPIFMNNLDTPFSIEIPFWIQGVLFLFGLGIPMFFLLVLGLKLLANNMKPLNSYFKYTLLAVWILSIIGIIYFGVKQLTEVSFNGKKIQKELLQLNPKDTVYFKMKFNDYYTKSFDYHNHKKITHDENNNPVIYSNDIRIHFMPSTESIAYIQIEKLADGNSHNDATKRAEKIVYKYEIKGNNVILDNYFVTDLKNKYRDQTIQVYIYLPKGTIFKTDEAIRDHDYSDNDFFNLHYSSDDYTYKVESNKIMCTNCPSDENEYDDVINTNEIEEELDSIENISLKINNKELNLKVDKDKIELSKK